VRVTPRKGCRRFAVLMAAAAAACVAAPRGSVAASVSASGAQRLTFLLEYIGTDYDAAVRDGSVVNQSEYGEVLRLVKQVNTDYAAQGGRSPEIAAGLRELQQSIERRAPSNDVWATTRRLLPLLSHELGGAALPA
jgi:high-affinity iron transporter